jgi:putative transcriptional regulator
MRVYPVRSKSGDDPMNHIREVREKAGIKQVDLYSRLKWSQSRLSNYENGHRTLGLNEARELVSALIGLGADCDLDAVFPASNAAA